MIVAGAVRRRVTVVMAVLAVVAFGFVGYSRLSVELFPDISYPSITVQTDFPDTAPQEVENLVSRRIEEAVGVLSGLQSVHSVSRSGSSEVLLEFEWGSNMDDMSMEVREKIQRLHLPREAETPIVLRFDPSLDPILRLALSGPGDLGSLRYLAERRIKQALETRPGVAAAQVAGGLEEEIQIEVDQEGLAARGITLETVQAIVGVSNLNLPGGSLRSNERHYLVRTINEFENLDEIRNLVVAQRGGAAIRLSDVAKVTRGAKEREIITRIDGRESIEISIYKEGDANIVATAEDVKNVIAQWQEKLKAENNTLTILFDQSIFISQAVGEVRKAALIGGALAIIILFFFLRDIRSTLIVATSIPISVIATFMVMYKMDVSLNLMSLGGLTLGLGMLLDSSIVVLESIFRKRQQGALLREASIEGTTEIAPAVIASTLTTVAVFLPIVFVEGVAGQLFKDQALTVTISLCASLLVAITLIPMLSALGSRREKKAGVKREKVRADKVFTLGVISRGYDLLARKMLGAPVACLATAFALFALSFVLLRGIGTELIPQMSEGEFYFEVSLPEGSALKATDDIILRMEEEAKTSGLGIDRSYSTSGSRLVSGGMSLNTMGENLGQINFVMKDRGDDRGEKIAIEKLRESYTNIEDLDVKFKRPSYFSLKTPIEIILFGDQIEELESRTLEMIRELNGVEGLVDVKSSLEAGSPELRVVFDRERIASFGLDIRSLTSTLRNRVLGVIPTRFRERERQIDIRIRNPEKDRSKIADIRNLIIPGPNGSKLRLQTVAEIRESRGPAEIHRLKQQRAAVITANLKKGYGLGSAIGEVKKIMARRPAEEQFATELGGQNREMEISFTSMMFALSLAIFLVYLVMASTFESFLHPFIILFTIPLSLIGVVAGLYLTGTTITVIVLIGSVMLAGIVVNNSIVLIDAINRLRRKGTAKFDAVLAAGHLRLRPILMTTLTTILGLLPMALSWGEGAELRTPLAITVISGLLFSTLITLVVIPAAYMLVPSRIEPDEAELQEGESP
ncbi:MAG: efflux RND transporter permease subunit [Planctomycetota bacterium]|nr:efflux RND transporter permease subunit [Planctomycetota bacterium]